MAYSTISKSSAYMNPKKYAGTGSEQSITGVGFQPDLSWIKNASSGSNYDHHLYDAIRGATKSLASNNSDAETTKATGLTAWGADGFTVGADVGVNSNGSTIISWNWKANGSGSSNGDGSITATVSANTASGFSMVKYTGDGSAATVGHGLGVAPKFVITKAVNDGRSWLTYNSIDGATKGTDLNSASAPSTSSAFWNDTAPTTSVVSLGGSVQTSGSYDYIMYCFAEIDGFSKIGSYTGNANAAGPFIYTGFKPAWVLIKSVSSTDWNMYDRDRLGYNNGNSCIFANLSNAEDSEYARIQLLSTGFKITTTNAQINNNNTEHVYMAFGQPIVSTNGDIATAR